MRENERRAFDRVSLPFEGRVTFESQEQELRADIRTKNISPAGAISLLTTVPLLVLRWSCTCVGSPRKKTPRSP